MGDRTGAIGPRVGWPDPSEHAHECGRPCRCHRQPSTS